MPQNQGPGVRRRVLASALTQLREEAGLDFDDVVENLGYSPSKISRSESAYTGVSIVDTRAWAELYGATPEKTAWLLRLAKVAKKRGWWHVYGDVLFDWFSEYVVLESEAVAIDTEWPWRIEASTGNTRFDIHPEQLVDFDWTE